ncbi:unnamed protein product [Lactuca virosa]|uniref:Protein kinase domain-containing protein n=1 Tax=Lactuca virosa TaxID=75947 RepID=A0AAU9LKZ2_9ASTR|nr:unnamed protein product [Lactuca virosa]
MILVVFFASFLLSCLPFLHSATNHSISTSICPKSFVCPHLAPSKYPFYNASDTQCGLIKVNCTSYGGEIRLGRDSYQIHGNFVSDSSIWVVNNMFEKLVQKESCHLPAISVTRKKASVILPMDSFYVPTPKWVMRTGTTMMGLKSTNTKKEIEKTHRKLTLILVLAGSAFILILSRLMFIIWRRYKTNLPSYYSSKDDISPNNEDGSLFYGVSVFSYTELENATENFDPSKELGNGGKRAVYYGKLQDGREVAVKRLYEHNYKRVKQFINEVKILTRLRHPNLVVLYGCTSRQSHELLLVYEYISNGTVADHLHGELSNPSSLTWPLRMNIAIETARALVYLHASEIIHRDVKTSNILLDHNFSAKVADFGLSRLIPNDVTHVSTAPQGTPGYVDPQYHHCYQLTDKSDVYSFGVVLIELISSMVAVDLSRSQDEISLADLALNRIQRCALDQLIDPDLGSNSDAEIMRMITSVAELAFQCLQYYSEIRPTMSEVLDVLEDIQAPGRIDSVKPPPPSEASDKTVLLKDFLPSPVSVTGEWHSESTVSTTLSVT